MRKDDEALGITRGQAESLRWSGGFGGKRLLKYFPLFKGAQV